MKHAVRKKTGPFSSGNRFSLLERPRSQDIPNINLDNKTVHDSIEHKPWLFSPHRKLIFGKKTNRTLEEMKLNSKFFGITGDKKEGEDWKPLHGGNCSFNIKLSKKPKVFSFIQKIRQSSKVN